MHSQPVLHHRCRSSSAKHAVLSPRPPFHDKRIVMEWRGCGGGHCGPLCHRRSCLSCCGGERGTCRVSPEGALCVFGGFRMAHLPCGVDRVLPLSRWAMNAYSEPDLGTTRALPGSRALRGMSRKLRGRGLVNRSSCQQACKLQKHDGSVPDGFSV